MKIQSSFPLKQSQEAKLKEQDGQMREAAKMYENHFMNEMVRAMRSTTGRKNNTLIKENFAEQIFSQQLDQKYVENWSDKGGIGLADMIYNQLREKYGQTTKKDFGRAPGALPIAPARESGGLKATDSIQFKTIPAGDGAKLNYRFEVQDPSGAGFEAVNPMKGVVKQAQKLEDGWNLVRLDHGQGIESEMTFPGHGTELGIGQALETGQRLGQLDPARPVLAWKLDWT